MQVAHQKIILQGLALCWLVMLLSCAQFGMPAGGPPDEDPPLLLEEGSTKNRQTNFRERQLVFQFNEWIQVKNASKEVFVSPPLAYPPKVLERGKKVVFEFAEEEVLKANTTYQINFGNAIKDFNEGLALENFVFLFSTGDKIDSLSLGGTVIDSQTDKAVKDILVMLYDNLHDTCFYNIKPLYLTRTDDKGQFKLENLRADTFNIYALKDDNVSYTYDLPTEQIAYLDSLIYLLDTTMTDIHLELFDEEDEPRLVESSQKKTGLIKLTYLPKPFKPKMVKLDSFGFNYFLESDTDTLFIWHDALDKDSLNFVIQHEWSSDTIEIKAGRKSIKSDGLTINESPLNIINSDTVFIEFNKPIDSIDISKLVLKDTSQQIEINSIGSIERRLWLLAELESDKQYNLVIDSAAVTDWYAQSNKDSVSININTLDNESLGNIELNFVNTEGKYYILELMNNKENIKTLQINNDEVLTLNQMSSGNYKFKIIQDLNQDGRWTAGSLKEKRPSELTKELNLEELKAGWDLQATVDFQELFYGTEIK